MPEKIPAVDPDLMAPKVGRAQNNIEFQLLQAEADLRTHSANEIRQRIRIKRTALWVGILVIACMACLLYHLLHHAIEKPDLLENAAFSVAIIVAPITSITTISIALLFGAFRRFDEKDIDNAGRGMSAGLNAMTGG